MGSNPTPGKSLFFPEPQNTVVEGKTGDTAAIRSRREAARGGERHPHLRGSRAALRALGAVSAAASEGGVTRLRLKRAWPPAGPALL